MMPLTFMPSCSLPDSSSMRRGLALSTVLGLPGLMLSIFLCTLLPAAASQGSSSVPRSEVSRVQWVGRFDPSLAPWREVRLQSVPRPNTFRFVEWEGVKAVEVSSEASMSLLARPISVDLSQTPVLCWRWRIGRTLSQADMRLRSGDDYAARVYVSFRLPPAALSFGLRTQLSLARAIWGQDVPDAAVNYVWDNRQPVGTVLPNAYTDRTQMVVLQSGDSNAGRWVWERVDIRRDVTRLFGAGAEAVQLAIAADTDNTHSSAQSGFADFHFVAADRACDEQ